MTHFSVCTEYVKFMFISKSIYYFKTKLLLTEINTGLHKNYKDSRKFVLALLIQYKFCENLNDNKIISDVTKIRTRKMNFME